MIYCISTVSNCTKVQCNVFLNVEQLQTRLHSKNPTELWVIEKYNRDSVRIEYTQNKTTAGALKHAESNYFITVTTWIMFAPEFISSHVYSDYCWYLILYLSRLWQVTSTFHALWVYLISNKASVVFEKVSYMSWCWI